MPRLRNITGNDVTLEDDQSIIFHWLAYLGNRTEKRNIFRDTMTCFLCEVVREKELNAAQVQGVTLVWTSSSFEELKDYHARHCVFSPQLFSAPGISQAVLNSLRC